MILESLAPSRKGLLFSIVRDYLIEIWRCGIVIFNRRHMTVSSLEKSSRYSRMLTLLGCSFYDGIQTCSGRRPLGFFK